MFLNQDTVIGYAPIKASVPIFYVDLGKEKVFDTDKAFEGEKAWYAFASEVKEDTVCFAVSRGKTFEETTAKTKDALMRQTKNSVLLRNVSL